MRRGSINRPPTPDAEEEDEQLTLQEIINIKERFPLPASLNPLPLNNPKHPHLDRSSSTPDIVNVIALCTSDPSPENLAFTRKKGRNNVTVDELVHVITPKGRASVPDSVKAELLQRIRSFLVSAAL
ncbi:hypothetical protein IFM89_023612 [Coptis chinensis]|uniref:Transcription and mRNA export factor ENY2 n=1 Tax=Coptis chinensis TaxID=261450 RepID=A0A835HP20_9MAGN|nr:hypothetical protein IFM89_023612 [Coptis chinensis]